MGLFETLVFYVLIGVAVAFADYLQASTDTTLAEQIFRVVSSILFWPIYLPLLLRSIPSATATKSDENKNALQTDSLSRAIAQVEMELDSALKSLDGWAENVLAGEQSRLTELRAAWRAQAERIRELDFLLASPEFMTADETTTDTETVEAGHPLHGRAHDSRQARRENIDRLRLVRKQLHDDLLGTLAWVRELVTMIHLAKFTGAPASRAQELIAQIAASVEGLSEVTAWKDESLVGSA